MKPESLTAMLDEIAKMSDAKKLYFPEGSIKYFELLPAPNYLVYLKDYNNILAVVKSLITALKVADEALEYSQDIIHGEFCGIACGCTHGKIKESQTKIAEIISVLIGEQLK